MSMKIRIDLIVSLIRRVFPLLLIGGALMYWLAVNYDAQRLCDEVSQVSQWLAFCTHGCVALGVVAVVLIVSGRSVRQLPDIIAWCVVAMGVIESVVAFRQLYGYGFSNNVLYKETGSFYNPGPLGGYLAVCIPAALALWRTVANKWMRHIALGALLMMLMVEPSTMSRSGWIAAVVGTLYVIIFTSDIRGFVEKVGRKRMAIALVGAAMVVAGASFAIWHIKSNSAFGRLLLWKISCLAIAKSPIDGYDSFQEAYGQAQEEYFASGGSDWEKHVAGSPDYAFNEYLHYAIEWGVPAMVAIIALIVVALVVGHRHKRYALCGAMLSMSVFAFSSYPMHIPCFVVVAVLLIMGCMVVEIDARQKRSVAGRIMTFIGLIAAGGYLWIEHSVYEGRQEKMKSWDKTKWFYTSKRYKLAVEQYERIAEDMDWNGRFLFEYGHSLSKEERYEESNEILGKAMKYSSDAMILNIIGKNYQEMGRYEEAEKCFRRSICRLPERVYPHYLLFLLYSEKDFYDEEKRQEEVSVIFDHTWKVESDATREIREKVAERLEEDESKGRVVVY